MKTKLFLTVLITVTLAFLSCTGGGGKVTLEDPTSEDSILIIGCVLFEFDGYRDQQRLYTDGLQVGIIGSYMENGQEKIFAKWVETDDEGYFFYPNAPQGKYEIKGVRFYPQGGDFWGIEKDHRSLVDNYYITNAQQIVFSGSLFNKEPEFRILDFKYNWFTVYRTSEVHHLDRYEQIKDLTLGSGKVIDRPLIFDYFIEKWQDTGSAWLPYLERIAARYKE